MGVRDRLEGNRLLTAAVVLLVLVGSLILHSSLTGDSGLQWTGTKVHGVERGGIVYYSYKGQNYSLDHSSRFASNTVAFDANDPADTAVLVYPLDRDLEAAAVLACYLAAIALAGYAVLRARRRTAEPLAGRSPDSYGSGLDPDVVRRLLEKRRSGE
jgi:hypothetical protein